MGDVSELNDIVLNSTMSLSRRDLGKKRHAIPKCDGPAGTDTIPDCVHNGLNSSQVVPLCREPLMWSKLSGIIIADAIVYVQFDNDHGEAVQVLCN